MSKLQDYLKKIHETLQKKESVNELVKEFMYEFLKTPHYWVVSPYVDSIQKTHPFVGVFKNEKPCLYVFTDPSIAKKFAVHNKLCDENENVYLMMLPTKHFAETIKNHMNNNVPLIMFDEGGHSLCHDINYFIRIIDGILQTVNEERKKEIVSYLIGDLHKSEKRADEIYVKLAKYTDILCDFHHFIKTGKYANIAVSQGFTAGRLARKTEGKLNPLGVYNYLIYLRDEPREAMECLLKGLPVK